MFFHVFQYCSSLRNSHLFTYFFRCLQVRLGDRSPADCPAGPRCVGPQLSVGTLAPETVEKTMEWEDHTVASCWFFKNVPIAHCCLSMFINVYHRILFRKFQILLERPQPLVQLLRMVNCCWFRASHSLMLVISPF